MCASLDYHLLDLAQVQAVLAQPPAPTCAHPESQTTRTLFDCPAIPLSPVGPLVRLIVAPSPATAEPPSIGVYARRTTRCKETLAELGFALGGKAAAALSAFPGLKSSRMTILRILRKTPAPAVPTPRMLGIDEWAYRRGKKDGTLLIDLEKGTPVELLPDRQAASVETWLKKHPGVQLISRDRSWEFARGARQGAPEALQTADRFPGLRNLAEVVEKVLGKHRRALKAVHLVTKAAASASPLLRHQRPERERRKQQARAKLVERYEAVQLLGNQGLSHKEISRRLHLHRESVIRYARAKTFPERAERPTHPGILAP